MPKATYSGDPSTNDRDSVRYLIGDTDDCDFLLNDSEIQFALTLEGDIYLAAANAAEAIAAKFSRLSDEKVGQISISCSQKADHYKKLSDKLRAKAQLQFGAPYAGGISKCDKDRVEDDTDRVDPKFSKTIFENSRTIGPDQLNDIVDD